MTASLPAAGLKPRAQYRTASIPSTGQKAFAHNAADSRRALWSPEDLLRSLGMWVIGTIMLVAGWYLAAGDATLRAQMAPADLAVAGAVIVGIANVLWVLRGRRAIGERLDDLLGPLSNYIEVQVPLSRLETAGALGVQTFVAGPGMRHFHRSDCRLAEGRNWSPLTAAGLEASGYVPCGICRPLS